MHALFAKISRNVLQADGSLGISVALSSGCGKMEEPPRFELLTDEELAEILHGRLSPRTAKVVKMVEDLFQDFLNTMGVASVDEKNIEPLVQRFLITVRRKDDKMKKGKKRSLCVP